MKLKIITESFDSGFRGEYKGYHIDPRLISRAKLNSPICIKIQQYMNKISAKLMNLVTVSIEMHDTIIYLNKRIEAIYKRMEQIRQVGIINDICEITYEKEMIIHIIKRFIDDLIMILYIFYASDIIEEKKKIEIASIGDLNKNNKICEKIKEDLKYDKYNQLFTVINNLHNAYKHSCLRHITNLDLPAEGEAYFLFYAEYNNLDKIKYLWHNLMHIVIGFSDFLLDFFIEEVDIDKHQSIVNEIKFINI